MIRTLCTLFVCAFISGCTCVADPAGTFACVRDEQCIDGYLCLSSRCQPAKTNRCPVVSCGDSACDGLACDGAMTQYCQRGICACVEAGGAPEVAETACGDGHDNDCDNKFDCYDSDCFAACDGGVPIELFDAGSVDSGSAADSGVADSGAQDAGRPADAGTPDAGTSPPADAGPAADAGQPETNCANGLDDDGDHLVDCEDPDCEARACPGLGSRVCCAKSCINPTSDAMNCGGCGLQCGSGQTCNSIALGGGRTTGTCTCASGLSCPMGQTCAAFSCTCSASSMCAKNSVCDTSGGLNSYCRVN